MFLVRVKNKMFYKFLITYIIILLIPIILGAIVYNRASKTIKDYAIESNMMLLNQSKNLLDKQLEDIYSTVILLVNNSKILEYQKVTDPLSSGDFDNLIDLKKELEAYHVVNNLILNYFVIYNNSKIVFSSNIAYKLEQFYPDVLVFEDYTFKQWYDIYMNKQYKYEYLLEKDITLDGEKHKAISYLYTLDAFNGTQALIMFLLDSEEIREMLMGLDITRGGWVCIFNERGEIISSISSSDTAINGQLINSIPDNASKKVEIDGNEFLVSSTKSRFNDWAYIAAQPIDIVLERVDKIKSITMIIVLCIIVLGLFTAILLASKNSKPIQEIIRIVKDGLNDNSEQKGLDFLLSGAEKLVNNKKELEIAIGEQKISLKNAFIEKLLNGLFKSEDEIRLMLSYTGVIFKGNYYNVIVLNVNNREEITDENKLKELNLKRVIIKDVIKTTIREIWYNSVIYNVDENMFAIIISFENNKKSECRSRVNELIKQTTSTLYDSYHIKTNISVGRFYNSLLNIAASYEEAKRAIIYRADLTSENIRWFEDIQIDSIRYYYPLESETRLMKFVRDGNVEKAEFILKNIYKENFIERQLSLQTYNHLLLEIKGTIFKVLERISWEEDVEYHNIEEMLSIIDNKKDIKDKYEYLQEIYSCICHMVKNQKKDYNEILKLNILKFTETNFTNNNFGLSMVSSEFNLSEAYLSQLFKDYTGEKFSIYLENLRMDAACNLLLNTNMNVKNIAKKTGYSASNTFSRAFKRNQGISPTHFRRKRNPNNFS